MNLLGFQPVEIIRLLLVLFLAGYFASRWDVLRHARETRAKMAKLTSRFDIPPVEYTLPALVCAALSVVFFFLQRDMGPALVFACLFLMLYGMARGSAFVPVLGSCRWWWPVSRGKCPRSAAQRGRARLDVALAVGQPRSRRRSIGAFAVGLCHGGPQAWARARRSATGAGRTHRPHSLGARRGVGFRRHGGGVRPLRATVWRGLRAALRARNDYEFFLAAGLAAATALQLLLIAGGSLGVVPLSGVVTPFLSYGRTAMLANFAVIAMVEAISHRGGEAAGRSPFRGVTCGGRDFCRRRRGGAGEGGVCASGARRGSDGRGTLVLQADGARRYQYNPRFQEVMKEIPKGTIYDRNGLPLATSNWDELEKHRADYKALGIDIDRACPRADSRYYPFGGLMFDLLGDCARACVGARATRHLWSATRRAGCAGMTTGPRWST